MQKMATLSTKDKEIEKINLQVEEKKTVKFANIFLQILNFTFEYRN